MPDVTKAASGAADGTTDGTDLGQWASESNAFATTGDNTYATAVLGTSKNTGRASLFSFPAFTSGDIPDGSTINSVTATVEWDYTVQVVGSTLGLQLYNAGSPLGTEVTKTVQGEEQSTHQVTTGVSLADLRAAAITANVRFRKGNNATDTTGRLDFVSLTVNYSLAGVPHTVEPADTLTLGDARSFEPGKGLASTLALADARAYDQGKGLADTLALADLADPDLAVGGAEAAPRVINLTL